jgi:hypothetical protein
MNQTAGVMPNHPFDPRVRSLENESSYLLGKFPARGEEAVYAYVT